MKPSFASMVIYLLASVVASSASSDAFARNTSEGTDRFELDLALNKCVSVTNPSLAREPRAIEKTDLVSSEFLEQNSVCAGTPTCTDAARIRKLEMENVIPSGMYVNSYLNGDAKLMADRACATTEFDRKIDLLKAITFSQNYYDTYPQEAKDLYEITGKAKNLVDNYLARSKDAVQALRKCFELNVSYDEKTKRDEDKNARYEKDLLANPEMQHGCQRIWKPESEISEIKNSLTRMRQVLVSYRLLKAAPSKSAPGETKLEKADLQERGLALVTDELVKDGSVPKWANDVLKVSPKPLNGGVLEKVYPDSIWTNAPKRLEALTASERKALAEVVEDVRKKHPTARVGDALLVEYFQIISEDPILVFFDQANPDAAGLLAAFEKNDAMIRKSSPTQIEDLDYLKIQSVYGALLKATSPAKRGDLCVLTFTAMKNRKEFADAGESLLMGAMLLEGGAAAWAAKGIFKSALALAFGARLSGTALAATTLSKSYAEFEKQLSICSQVSTRSKQICDVAELDSARNDMSVGIGLATVFGGGLARSVGGKIFKRVRAN